MLPRQPLPLLALNELLDRFVDEYNNREHSAIKQTPYNRYREDLSCVRPAPERILDYFRRREYRRVKKDRSVQVAGRVFEVPAKLIDKTVELFFHNDTPEDVEVMYQSLTYGKAVPLDLNVNARIGRDWGEGNAEIVKKKAEIPPMPVREHEIRGGQLFESGVLGEDHHDA